MAYEFKFPDVGEGIKEGEIVKWFFKEGDYIRADQIMGKVETDKAVVDIPCPQSGKILKILVKEGKKVKVGQVMIVIGKKGEKYIPGKSEEVGEKKPGKAYGVVGELEVAPKGETLAMPRTRKLAYDLGIDISKISGYIKEEGLIKKEEVKEPIVKNKYDMYGYIERIKLKGIRMATAKKMSEAWKNVPLVTHMDEAFIDGLIKLREEKNKISDKKKIKLTYLPFIIKAIIASLKDFMIFNSSLEDEDIAIKKYFNIGIAVDTKEGLMVPVIKEADKKDIFHIAKEIQELAERAKKRTIDPADLKGGSFTITNVGSIGGKFFTPIVNYPESSILGLGRIEDKVFYENGKFSTRKILPISFSFDHRIADGAQAAGFINKLKKFLEEPISLRLK